jgi:hypothetical protein
MVVATHGVGMPLMLRDKELESVDEVLDHAKDFKERNGRYPNEVLLTENQAKRFMKTWDWSGTSDGHFLYDMKCRF